MSRARSRDGLKMLAPTCVDCLFRKQYLREHLSKNRADLRGLARIAFLENGTCASISWMLDKSRIIYHRQRRTYYCEDLIICCFAPGGRNQIPNREIHACDRLMKMLVSLLSRHRDQWWSTQSQRNKKYEMSWQSCYVTGAGGGAPGRCRNHPSPVV